MFRAKDIGVAALDVVGEKLVLHSDIERPIDIRVIRRVMEMIDDSLMLKGVERYYTWAQTDEQYRFNLAMGFEPTGEEVYGLPVDEPVYEFVKVL